MKARVKNYGSCVQADLARMILSEKGITAKVRRLSRYGALSGAGYALETTPDDVEEAVRILNSVETEVDMDEYVDPDDPRYPHCPDCSSVNVKARPLSGWLLFGTFLTLGALLLFIPRDWDCKKCGNAWRK